MHASTPSPTVFGLVIALPYGCALLLTVSAAVTMVLLASQVRYYVRLGHRRRTGDRVMLGSVVCGIGLWVLTQVTVLRVAPSRSWFEAPMLTSWDWVVGAGYVFYFLASALFFVMGIVASAVVIAWNLGEKLRNKETRERWAAGAQAFTAGLGRFIHRRPRRSAAAS
ncbi:hypothetical protein I3U63_22875 [Mycobacteroides abscessus subsp. massiliense]|uniref:hypothetical protein n=1 Tax=Mycobacteroides abscessus TaxID=36809 RepID=UPI0019D2E74C|nr:hypothetical protein [Mycobacteroides abscessus]MBN7324360.1 hypothetical protein [Mycobacteroides abscessus subsp. massiliense]